VAAVAAGQQLGGVHVLAGEHVGHVRDLLAQRLRVNAVGLVVGDLLGAAPLGLLNGRGHGRGGGVGVHVHLARDIAGGAPNGLNEGGGRAQEALLVRVQNGHQGDLRQVQALAQQVNAHQHVELPQAQLAQQLHAPQGVDVGVQVLHAHAPLGQVGGQVLGHALGQGGHQDPLAALDAGAHLLQQVVDLAPRGLDHHSGVHQAGGADDLLDDAVAAPRLVGTRGGRQVDGLADALLELGEGQRPVVQGGGQAEAVLHQGPLARGVALVHGPDLRHRHMGLVDDQQEVLGEVVQQGVGRGAGAAPVYVQRVVLNARAHADLAEHLQVVGGAHAQALGFQEPAVALQDGQALGQFGLNALHGPRHALGAGHVVGGGEDEDLVGRADDLPAHRVEGGQGLDLVAEELHADGQLLVHGDDLHGVPAHPEGAAGEVDVVAGVLHGHEAAQQLVAVNDLPHGQRRHAVHVLLGGAQAVDARDRGDHDRVAAGQQGVGGRVAQALDLVVNGGVLLNEGVRLGDVGLGLVVVVVGHEVLHRIVRQQLAELGGHLGGQGLIGLQNEGGALEPLHQPGGGGGLAGAGGPQQDNVLLPRPQASLQLVNGGRLVPAGRVGADDLEGPGAAAQIGDGTHGPRLRGPAGPRPHRGGARRLSHSQFTPSARSASVPLLIRTTSARARRASSLA